MSFKIIYTSDLHGNKDFYNKLIEKAKEEQIKAVVIGGDLCPRGGNTIQEAIQHQKEFLESYFILELKKLMKDINVGEAAQKQIDALLLKIRRLIKASKIAADLAPRPDAVKAITAGAPLKKFASLIQQGSDAAFKAIMGQLFDAQRDTTPVEEKQLETQKAILRTGETLNSLMKRQFDLNVAAKRIF